MNYAILLAAGLGTRIHKETFIKSNNTGCELSNEKNTAHCSNSSFIQEIPSALPKQFLNYNDKPLWWHSVNTFMQSPLIHGIILVFHKETLELAKEQMQFYSNDFSVPIIITTGGERRQDSVYNGLLELPKACEFVAIHDTARPFVTTSLVTKTIQYLLDNKDCVGVIPALDLVDTVKVAKNGRIIETLDRNILKAVQTPQTFRKNELIEAYDQYNSSHTITDDASILELANKDIAYIEGEIKNTKITNKEDLALLNKAKQYEPVTAYGYDVHAYVTENSPKARPFKLATVPIPSKHFIKAHSDGDTLIHSLIDALLSLIGAGDIGKLFPDTDKQYDNLPSSIMLDKVLTLLAKEPIKLCHVDITVIAQEPKISPYTQQMCKILAQLLSLPLSKINVKATTEEKLGFTGELKGIKVVSLVSALREVE